MGPYQLTPVNLPLQLKQTWVLLLWLLLEEHSTIMCLLPMGIWQCTMREHLLTAAQATVPMMVNIITMPIFCVTLMHQMLQFANRLVGQEIVMAAGTFLSASKEEEYEFDDSDGCNLDIANGAIHPTTGKYSYFMTTTFPWVPMYYYGDGGVADVCSAA